MGTTTYSWQGLSTLALAVEKSFVVRTLICKEGLVLCHRQKRG